MKNDDWRLTNQMDYLYEKKLELKPYQPYRDGWEHDHCEFCCETIDNNSPDAYTTEDNYHWICQECFNDFKDMFKWKVQNTPKYDNKFLSVNDLIECLERGCEVEFLYNGKKFSITHIPNGNISVIEFGNLSSEQTFASATEAMTYSIEDKQLSDIIDDMKIIDRSF